MARSEEGLMREDRGGAFGSDVDDDDQVSGSFSSSRLGLPRNSGLWLNAIRSPLVGRRRRRCQKPPPCLGAQAAGGASLGSS